MDRKLVVIGGLLFGLVAWDPSGARAATHCVKPGGGSGCFATIPLALAAADGGDTIRVAAGTYLGVISINENVTLEGGWNDTFTARDPLTQASVIRPAAGQQLSVVSIFGSIANPALSTPVVDGLVISGGRADLGGNHGGGMNVRYSHATIRRSVMTGNRASSLGGGIWIQGGAPRFESLQIEDNVVVDFPSGGGVYVENASATFVDTVFRANRSDPGGDGGGLAIRNTTSGTKTVRITGGRFEDNRAGVPSPGSDCPGEGGAIFSDGNALLDPAVLLIVDGSVFSGNCGDFGGGGLDLSNTRYVVTNSLFVPPANTFSPAIDASEGTGIVTNSTFVGVNAARGIRAARALTLTNSILEGFGVGVDYSVSTSNQLAATFNDFFGNVTNLTVNNLATALGPSNLLVDPLLDGSFHLSPGSPVIDAGTRTNAPARDIDTEPRPMAVLSTRYRMDIGADEFSGAPQYVTNLDLDPADLTIVGPGNPPENAASTGTNDWIGYSVLGEDVNGDGQDDLLIGAQDFAVDFDGGMNATGRVFGMFHFGSQVTGTLDLAQTAEDLALVSQTELRHLGERLLGADLNGDGDKDLIVAAADNHGGGRPPPPGLRSSSFSAALR